MSTSPDATPDTPLDGPWKDAIERYFREFTQFFFPAVHAGIDWGRGYEFLDTELQKVLRDAAVGNAWPTAW